MTALYLVDGSFELFRCFHGSAPAVRADGQPVGAVRALFQTFASLLRQDDLTHVAVAFDNLYAGGGRTADDSETVRRQYDLALEVTRSLGMRLWPMTTRWQADDALATAASRFTDDPQVERIVLCSADADFAQCLRDERVVQWNRIRKEWITEADVIARFGVTPAQIPTYLALVGDRSDGIPGIPGFGPQTAARLIGRYDTLERIGEAAGSWDVDVRDAQGLAATLQQRWGEALLYRNLSIRGRIDGAGVPLPDSLQDLRWSGADRAGVERLARRLEDPTMLERTIRWRD